MIENLIIYITTLEEIFSNSSSLLIEIILSKLKALFIIPFILFLMFYGSKFALGLIDAKELKIKLFHVLKILVLIIGGVYFLSIADKALNIFEKTVNSVSTDFYHTLTEHFDEKLKSKNFKTRNTQIIETLDDVEELGTIKTANGVFFDIYSSNRAIELMKQNYKTLSKSEMDGINEIISNSSYSLEENILQSFSNNNLDEDILKQKEKEIQKRDIFKKMSNVNDMSNESLENTSFWNLTIDEIIISIAQWGAGIAIAVVKTFRFIILLILKIAFPFVLLWSLIPTKEKTLKVWADSYLSVFLWGITIIILEIAMKTLFSVSSIMVSDQQETATMFNLIANIIILVSYSAIPVISNMIFGGSEIVGSAMSMILGVTIAKTMAISNKTKGGIISNTPKIVQKLKEIKNSKNV